MGKMVLRPFSAVPNGDAGVRRWVAWNRWKIPSTIFDVRRYRSEIFKEFEKFDYRFGTEKGHLGPIHIFEKATGTVVADYI